ncbi:MAG TPA: ribonuclease P protein component 1 [archaeon]|nr:ribonuclease P protein component 1 [archaeon]
MLKTEHYCITPGNIMAHELIGLDVKVLRSTDQSRKGIMGKVVDETKNVIIIETNGIEKKIPKNESEFEFMIGKEKAVVSGKKILYTPEQRAKVLWRNAQ